MNKQQWIDQYIKNQTLISKGAFSYVYSDKSHVKKVCFDDPAYFAFIDVVVKHQDNVWLPKIYDVNSYTNQSNDDWIDARIITMEKLASVDRNLERLAVCVRGYLIIDDCTIADNDIQSMILELKDNVPQQFEQLCQVRDLVLQLRELYANDLYNVKNIMTRQQQLVIVDPVTIPMKFDMFKIER